MEKLKKFDSIRNYTIAFALLFCFASTILAGTIQFISAICGIGLLAIGNILNVIYVVKVKKSK